MCCAWLSHIFLLLQIKPWSELSGLLKLYFCFTIASLLALLGLTISSICKQRMNTDVSHEDNLTVSLILLVVICEYPHSVGKREVSCQYIQEVDLMLCLFNSLLSKSRSFCNKTIIYTKKHANTKALVGQFCHFSFHSNNITRAAQWHSG